MKFTIQNMLFATAMLAAFFAGRASVQNQAAREVERWKNTANEATFQANENSILLRGTQPLADLREQ